MSAPTRLIVYRNPVEAAFWESGMLFPLLVSIFVGVFAAIMFAKAAEAFYQWRKTPYHTRRTDVVALVAAVAGMGYTLCRFGVL